MSFLSHFFAHLLEEVERRSVLLQHVPHLLSAHILLVFVRSLKGGGGRRVRGGGGEDSMRRWGGWGGVRTVFCCEHRSNLSLLVLCVSFELGADFCDFQ